MAYLFKEMTRYKMDKDLTLTHHRGYGNDYYTINVPGKFARSIYVEDFQLTG